MILSRLSFVVSFFIVFYLLYPVPMHSERVVVGHGTGTVGVRQGHDYKPTRVCEHNRFFVTHPHAPRHKHAILLPHDTVTGPNFPDAGSLEKTGNWRKAYWGQRKNGKEIAKYIERDKPHVLLGTSRGCAAIIRGLEFVSPGTKKEIKIIYFESPYARIVDCVNYIADQHSKKTGFGGLLFKYISSCSESAKLRIFNWTNNGWGLDRHDLQKYGSPIDQVKHLPRDAYVIITATIEDKVVPVSSTIRLYLAIREQCPNTYLILLHDNTYGNKTFTTRDGRIELERSHDNQVNMAEAIVCQDVMQAIRKRCGLSCDECCASIGERLLSGCDLPSYVQKALKITHLQPDHHILVCAGLLKK